MRNAKYPSLAAGGTATKNDGLLSETLDLQSLTESLAQDLKKNPEMLRAALNSWRVRNPDDERMEGPTLEELAEIMLPMWMPLQRN